MSMYMCVQAHTCVWVCESHMCIGAWAYKLQKKELHLLWLEEEVIVSLETELWRFGRAVSTVNCWAISSVLPHPLGTSNKLLPFENKKAISCVSFYSSPFVKMSHSSIRLTCLKVTLNMKIKLLTPSGTLIDTNCHFIYSQNTTNVLFVCPSLLSPCFIVKGTGCI